MAKIIAAVYDPPKPGLPFLGVVFVDGEPTVAAFATAAEAQAFVNEVAQRIARDAGNG